ncbi:hypothetical protein QOZ80_2BG0162070 [Eleusine coracana subsp. coracana]|nr:hypothetical protein QOZ80_2BG0162070 [Eleusine coracana subsp. coracana]
MAHETPPSLPDLQAQDGGGVMTLPLPQDAVYEILLRLSAKDICRLRAVCRPWRSLLSDPQFIAAHVARHPRPPLVVAGYHTAYREDGVLFDIVDLSGDVVRRVRAVGDEWVTSVNLNFVCTAKGASSNIRLFNMTTGAVFALPQGLAKEHADDERDILDYTSVSAFGQVASTGEYKVLRILDSASFDNPEQLCEVFTLDGSDRARWRGKKAPPDPVSMSRWKSVVVSGIVYFFGQDSPLAELCSFDLEREEWRRGLPGPNYQQLRTNELSMAAVNDSLVIVHRYLTSYMDLWFLMDFEKGLWVKKHSIRAQLRGYSSTIRPLLVLSDGRIVLVQLVCTLEVP